ncbi:ABC transporter substrate-binding protein [Vibrio sp. RE86]|uniref:ABC transporter substrate-binding protein n=1 Tax=Vibrio sp. RE86 TaxID=2607605 RepID=UPI00149332FF|nr:ABC transporter substrate-binding protein [Vibrio sp. RE86]NOH81017.1 ABC transporter substrate-binding protein [Vibrio sp. RE86]
MRKLIGAIALAVVSVSGFAQTLNIPGKVGEDKFTVTLLKEFVKRSDNYDQVHHIYGTSGDPAQSKMMADVELGSLDVVWMGTTKELETSLSPVYVPIYRGLLGMRLPIVERDKADIFNHVDSLSEMQRFTACQGKTWSDTLILEANGINVAKSLKYPNLFYMLEGDRCDYFPRGFFEPYPEVQTYSHLNLTVDEHVILRYRMPLFFFTAKNKPELAREMTQVFADMYQDGSFQSLFFAEPEIADAMRQAKVEKRTIFDLRNPELSEATNNIPSTYWFDTTQETH